MPPPLSARLQNVLPKAETMNQLLLYGFVAAFALLFLLVFIASRVEWVAAYYPWVFWLNVGVISILGVATASRIGQLWVSVRHQQHGSRLARRLFTILALTSIVPSMVVYGLSYRFLDSAIESWFRLEIDKTVTEGIDLARWVREEESNRMVQAANGLSQILSTLNTSDRRVEIAKWRELLGVEEISLFDESLTPLIFSLNDRYALSPNLPSALSIKDVGYRAVARIENAFDNLSPTISQSTPHIRVLVKIPIHSYAEKYSSKPESLIALHEAPSALGVPLNYTSGIFLQLYKAMPDRINQSTRQLATAYQRYGELQQGRDGLKKLFLTALTILFVLTLITALSLAFHYSNRFVQPLAVLVEGTRAVARGDFTRPIIEGNTSHDEFDQLIMSFNDMLADLKQAQEKALYAQQEIAESKVFLDKVLNHINAGVMIVELVGHDLRLILVNNAAHRLLGMDLLPLIQTVIDQWEFHTPMVRPLAHAIRAMVNSTSSSASSSVDFGDKDKMEWANQVEMRLPAGFRSLMVRGTLLPDHHRWVVVFDDISELLRAQHLHIWSEMARRLAHEIKNPLTPIQLSAERMMMKIGDKLPEEADREFLERSVGTIVSQVDAIKTLVNQFREMSRPASTQLEIFRVNDLLQEVVALYDDKRISLANTRKKYKLFADRHQLRQVLHNLILNAEQANMERLGEWAYSRVRLTLQEGYVNEFSEGRAMSDTPPDSENAMVMGVWITVADIGGGFAQTMIDRGFEPNVTSKIKGSGLGLAIVRKIIEEHRGTIFVVNEDWVGGSASHSWDNVTKHGEPVRGALVRIWLPQYKEGGKEEKETNTTMLPPTLS